MNTVSPVPKINQRRISQEARFRWGVHCPCCGHAMEDLPYCEGERVEPTAKTKGHNLPRGQGRYYWIHICRACNAEQADRTFREWSLALYQTDRKEQAARVRLVAQLFADFTGT